MLAVENMDYISDILVFLLVFLLVAVLLLVVLLNFTTFQDNILIENFMNLVIVKVTDCQILISSKFLNLQQ